jgi:hypothetical protein
MTRYGLAFLVGVVCWTAGATAWAQDPALKKFFGTFRGSGVEENEDSLYFRTTVRDFDVTIAGAGEGFRIEWVTITRRGDLADPKIKRKAQEMQFVPSSRPGIWEASPQGNPFAGEQLAWAQVEGTTLRVNMLTLTEDGSYTLQQWLRTLTGSGMTLTFTRLRDGEPVRTVYGFLTKEAG